MKRDDAKDRLLDAEWTMKNYAKEEVIDEIFNDHEKEILRLNSIIFFRDEEIARLKKIRDSQK